MTQSYSAGGSRQAAVLTAIVGFHFGMFLLIAAGLGPRIIDVLRNPDPPPVKLLPPEKQPLEQSIPGEPRPLEVVVEPLPKPDVEIPVIPNESVIPPPQGPASMDVAGGSGSVPAASEMIAPRLKSRGDRLAALIDSCYPAASRRAAEEGRTVVRLMIDGRGRAASWKVTASSGFPRLDAAVSCIIERLEFIPGRQDGRAVEAEAELPVVFRLH
ncbi:MAG: TonB family protein [Steroidobacteraceae bacterium]